MGAVTGLLFGPVKLVAWTAEQLREAAVASYHDEHAIVAALVELNDAYDRGEIDDATFEATEDQLMERLELARTGGPT